MALCFLSTRRMLRGGAVFVLVLLLLLLSNFLPSSTRQFDTRPWVSCPSGASPFDKLCNIPRTSFSRDVQIVVKTGGTEQLDRLRYQLATLLSEVPPENLLIFSDLEKDLGAYHIHDVYANISQEERSLYPEFKLYDEQLAYQAAGKDTSELEGGWKLDKYKNLPMKRALWQLQKARTHQMKWFVFIDTDTFVDWDNLFGLLQHLDASSKLYLGSPVWVREEEPRKFSFEFAHGGSAYVLSYGALKVLNTVEAPDAPGSLDPASPMYSQFGTNVTALCCGDEAVARALLKRGIRMKGYWPLFNGEIPATATYGKDLWCEPVISLHHIGEQNLGSLWAWIVAWKHRVRNQQPLLWKDLFEYVAADFSPRRDDWVNTESADLVRTEESFEDCRAACEDDKLCFQFVFHGKRCELSHSIRLGRAREMEKPSYERYFSGWNIDRIREWTTKTECSSAHWVHSNP